MSLVASATQMTYTRGNIPPSNAVAAGVCVGFPPPHDSSPRIPAGISFINRGLNDVRRLGVKLRMRDYPHH
jgi:hypothetical protein